MNELPKSDYLARSWIALALTVGAAFCRLGTLGSVSTASFSPIIAIAFCTGAFFPRGRMWAVPFAAMMMTEVAISRYHAYTSSHLDFSIIMVEARLGCFLAALLIGSRVARSGGLATLLSGVLSASLLFYFLATTASWLGDRSYIHNAAGWWTAMTVGHPEFRPAATYFRTTLIGDILFAGLMSSLMSPATVSQKEPFLAHHQHS